MTTPQSYIAKPNRLTTLAGNLSLRGKKPLSRAALYQKKDFWLLGGSLNSPITLTDEQLRKARDAFS